MGLSRIIDLMKYWMMKCEPSAYSIADLKRDGVTPWEGVRNYQARNFMRDQMQVGDKVLFYHSNAKPSGVVGCARVSKQAYPDHFGWDPSSKYYDPKASPEKPIWMMVEIAYEGTLSSVIPLAELHTYPELEGLLVLKKGQRLSILPMQESHYHFILGLRKITS